MNNNVFLIIRHKTPKEMDTESFAEAYCQAEWLERFRLRNQAEMIAAMFGGKKKG